MRFQETETVELKSIVMDDLKKEIIAFANCDGRESDRAGACEMLAAAAALCEDTAAERLPALRQARSLWPKLGVCAGLLAAVLWG